jgi:hypothetical protein
MFYFYVYVYFCISINIFFIYFSIFIQKKIINFDYTIFTQASDLYLSDFVLVLVSVLALKLELAISDFEAVAADFAL